MEHHNQNEEATKYWLENKIWGTKLSYVEVYYCCYDLVEKIERLRTKVFVLKNDKNDLMLKMIRYWDNFAILENNPASKSCNECDEHNWKSYPRLKI